MKADKARLRRLTILARVKDIEHRKSAAGAVAAIARQQQNRRLAQRAGDLSSQYDCRRDADSGYALAAQQQARAQTARIARQTDAQAAAADELARQMLAGEREARRRRDRTREEVERVASEAYRAQSTLQIEAKPRAKR